MNLEFKCLPKIYDNSERKEATQDYASLLGDLGYSPEMGAIYASLPAFKEYGITADELEGAGIAAGHGCAYVRNKYGTKELCESCPMHDHADARLIHCDSPDVTQDNIRDLDAWRAKGSKKQDETEDKNTSLPAEDQKEGNPAPVTVEENLPDEDAEQRERKLLIHLLSQKPTSLKTMFPAEKTEKDRITALFVSTVQSDAVDAAAPFPVNRKIYELLHTCIETKRIKGATAIANYLAPDTFTDWFCAYNAIKEESARAFLESYYTTLRKEAFTYGERYTAMSEWERRKAREDVFAYFKGSPDKEKKPKKAPRKGNDYYSQNMSFMDIYGAESTAPSSPMKEEAPAPEDPEEDEYDIDTFVNEGKTRHLDTKPKDEPPKEKGDNVPEDKTDKGDKGQPAPTEENKTETPAAAEAKETEKTAPSPVANPHAILAPDELKDWFNAVSAARQNEEPAAGKDTLSEKDTLPEEGAAAPEKGNDEPKETKEDIVQPTPEAKEPPKPETAEKKKKNRNKKKEDAVPAKDKEEKEAQAPQFELKAFSFSDSLFTNEDLNNFPLTETSDDTGRYDRDVEAYPEDTATRRDFEWGSETYSYEMTLSETWLKDNNIVDLNTVAEGEANKKLMYAFMKSLVIGVEAVRIGTLKKFNFLLYFGDIGERYAIEADSNPAKTTVKRYLKAERFKKISTCPVAVMARCAALGFMPQNLSYACKPSHPLGTFAAAERISECGFVGYNEEYWKWNRAAVTDARLMYFEQALSRSLYYNGTMYPFIETDKGKYIFLNMVHKPTEKVIVRARILDDVTKEAFKRFADATIRKLEENEVFYKYNVYIVGLDYEKRLLAYAVDVPDYRAFYTCLSRVQLKIFNKIFRAGEVRPKLRYETERYAATSEPQGKTS